MESMDVRSFVTKQLDLLELERLEELEESRILGENTCLKYLQQKGICIPKLYLTSSRVGLYGRSVVTFEPYLGKKNLPSHCVSSGDIIGIAVMKSDGNHDIIVSGVATEVKTESISIALAKDASETILLENNIPYYLIKLFNDSTYKTMKMTLKSLEKGRYKRCLQLTSVLFGNLAPSSCDSVLFENMIFFNQNLNDTQKKAVKFALSQKEVAILHGPPGTGKTTTVVEMIMQAVSQGLKVLACANSNVAVDNLVEKLSHYQVKMIRIGHPARFLLDIQRYSLDAVMSKCDSSSVTDDLRAEIGKIKSKIEAHKGGYSQTRLWAECRSLITELKNREKRSAGEVLRNAHIVLSTCASANPNKGSIKHLPEDYFDLVVIDECSQALEASCWIPLLQAPRCILAGDHLQLPPTIKSDEAAKGGLSVTLMERLIKLYGQGIVKRLDLQYRMHQNIMEWPSQQMYEKQLVADSSVSSHLLKDLPGVKCDENTSIPLLLIDTTGCDLDELEVDEESKGNEGEADLVHLHVESLINSGVKSKDVAVITPYNLQVDLIKSRLSYKYPDLEVKTVDGFQGREKEAVVLSFVRSNKKGELGFLSEDRRINVAVTRAKRHLAVICNSETVSRDSCLKSFMDYIESKGEVRSAAQYEDGILCTPMFDTIQMTNIRRLPNIAQKSKCCQLKQNGKGQKLKDLGQSHLENAFLIECVPSVSHNEESRVKKIEDFKSILNKFLENEKESLLVFAPSLNSFERRIIHEISEELGLIHLSQGESSERYILVKKVESTTQTEEIAPLLSNLNPISPSILSSVSEQLQNMEIDTKVHIKQKRDTSGQEQNKQEEEKCLLCGKMIPLNNINLHILHCKETVVTKEKKKKSTKPKSKTLVSEVGNDEFDSLVEDAIKANNSCSYDSCQKSTTSVGQVCQFCRTHFCFSHFLPEIHGCGAAAKAHARGQIKKTGKLYPGSGKPEKYSAPIRHAQLAKQLDKKISELSKQRKAKPKG